ncbi:hypothetical protein GCM10027446_13370 [Angustibacter peucedani]
MTHPALDAFGDLDAAAADPHVAGCARCQADLAAQQEVRALLAGLPDPGPAPDDVVERLSTTLRQLAAAEPLGRPLDSVPDDDPAAGSAEAGSTVVPIGSAPSARRRRPLLAVAAALVLVAGGGAALSQIMPGSGGADSSAAGGAAASIAQRSAGDDAEQGTGQGVVRSIASGTDYTRAGLAREVDATLARKTSSGVAGVQGPLSDATGVASCVAALGAGAARPLLVDVARFEGQPAAVVVLPATGGGREIWVVSTSCAPGQDGTKYFTTAR